MSKANTRVIDLPSKQNPTGEEQIYIATETTDEKISLSEMREFLSETFVEKSENLSDINKETARENLQVYSKQEVDEKNNEQDTKIEANRVKNNEQDEKITTHQMKITEREEKDNEQDRRLESIENTNQTQDRRLQTLENTNTETSGRLQVLEQTSEAMQAKNTTQDERI